MTWAGSQGVSLRRLQQPCAAWDSNTASWEDTGSPLQIQAPESIRNRFIHFFPRPRHGWERLFL